MRDKGKKEAVGRREMSGGKLDGNGNEIGVRSSNGRRG